MNLKLVSIGSSVGVILPKNAIKRLHLKKGDKVFMSETPNGIELTPFDPEVATQMQLAEDIMRENRNVLRKLAQ